MIDKSRLDSLLQKACAEGRVPGVVAMAADAGGILYQGAAGLRSLDTDAPMTLGTVFSIASMTKAVTAAAAMQLIEQGKLDLDEPLGRFAPQLANPMVLEGFDESGQAKLRPATRPITMRALMTHTAGFGYDIWNAHLNRHMREAGIPGTRTGDIRSLDAPLGFEPGERWNYGIGIDWIGRVVEALSGQTLDAYFRDHLFAPLAMRDTGFLPDDAQVARNAATHLRKEGQLQATPYQKAVFQDFFPGGGGLFSTAGDYMRFLRALLNGGVLDGARILKPETVALMGENHMGPLNVLPMHSVVPQLSNDCELFPGIPKKWGLSFLINAEDVPGGRSAGSLCWAGLRNTYYWLDPKRGVAAVLMTQILPFADVEVLSLLDAFEQEVYRGLA